MSERFGFDFALWAGEVGVFVGPGRVGSQVAFRRSHLMDSSCHKLPQAHKGVGGEGGGVVVVRGRGVFIGPVLEEHESGSGPKRPVGLSHEVWGGNICAWRGEGV